MDSQVTTEYDQLERKAATVLGYMLLEYSRLDMELGLLLAWSDDGRRLTELTKRLTDENFNSRLVRLEGFVREKYNGTPAADLYNNWLSDAHAIRSIRNQLFHGRWGIMPQQQVVANVVGLPTSPEQHETHYSIGKLKELLQAIRVLRTRLSDLRHAWPV
jgi:hypothetical protein